MESSFEKREVLFLPLYKTVLYPPPGITHKVVEFTWKMQRIFFEIESLSIVDSTTKVTDSLRGKLIKGKHTKLVIGEKIRPFNGKENYVPFHNVHVYDPKDNFLAATSWKRGRRFIENGKAIIRTHTPFSIQLSYEINLSSSHNPLRYSGGTLSLNFCEICQSKNNLTRHHIWPNWHPRSTPEGSKDCTFNTAVLCQTCHSDVEKFYREALAIEENINFEELYQEFCGRYCRE